MMKQITLLMMALLLVAFVPSAFAEEKEKAEPAKMEIQEKEAEKAEKVEEVPVVEPASEPMEKPVPRVGKKPEKKTPKYTFSFEEERVYEATAVFAYLLPADSDWDGAVGGEVKFRFWLDENWGVAAAIGQSDWSFSGGPVDIGTANVYQPESEGDSTIMPVTLSGCYRWNLNESLDLLAEFGLRYVMIDSEVGVNVHYVDYYNRDVHYTTFVENEDKFMIALGAELRGPIGEQGLWTAGLEYQLEAGSSDPNWLQEDLGNDYDAFALRVGGGFEW